jgi:hypothetical protein
VAAGILWWSSRRPRSATALPWSQAKPVKVDYSTNRHAFFTLFNKKTSPQLLLT